MKKIVFILLTIPAFALAQKPVHVSITLYANEGGFHSNVSVTLIDMSTSAKFSGTTNANGNVMIDVPGNASYNVKIPNYTERKILNVPNAPGATMTTNIYYSRNMLAEEAAFKMTDAEAKGVDAYATALPDTTFIKSPYAEQMKENYNCVHIRLEILDLNEHPLTNEVVRITGRKRHKTFKGTTGSDGVIYFNLPKGDDYDLSFFYHHDYEYTECRYTKGLSEVEWQISYIGTAAYKKIRDEEARRLKEEEERLAAEKKRFEDFCAAHHCTPEEGHALELREAELGGTDIASILARNKFAKPLFVTDVTGSMSPYMGQVANWFKAIPIKETGAQFIFFNDGDNKPDNAKIAGSIGGIYYYKPNNYDTLVKEMSYAASRGNGGDAPENNLEAVIKGCKLAKDYTDIVMIADDNAPVKDMSLLSQVNKPVHIILCGQTSNVERDYLIIAWKTHGSIHTSLGDYDLSTLQEGKSIKIDGKEYRLMHGDFIPVN